MCHVSIPSHLPLEPLQAATATHRCSNGYLCVAVTAWNGFDGSGRDHLLYMGALCCLQYILCCSSGNATQWASSCTSYSTNSWNGREPLKRKRNSWNGRGLSAAVALIPF